MSDRILVAGHERLVPSECLILLRQLGYEVSFLASPHDVVASFLDDPPCLLMVDFDNDRTPLLFKSLKSCMQKTNVPSMLVLNEEELLRIDWELYPVDDFIFRPLCCKALAARIALSQSRVARVFDNNPLSRLPGNTSIIKAIQRAIDAGDEQCVGYIDIDNFKPYNDRYGFSRGDEVLLMVARLLVNAVEELALAGSFVGHVGGDDFVFVVAGGKIGQVCERIIANFDSLKHMFLSQDDIKANGFIGTDRQGNETRFDLLSLSIAVVVLGKAKFRHYGEVSTAATQMKKYVKQFAGSNYKIDRREAGNS